MSFRSRGAGRTLLPFGLDYSDILTTNFDTEKPKIILPINAPLSEKERDEAIQAINMSKLVLNGPFYTGDSLDDNKKTTSLTLDDRIERYTDKYKKVKKIGTTIEDHPYNLEFFPAELHSVMGVSKKKKIGLSAYKSTKEMDDGVNGHAFIDEAKEDKAKLLVEKLKNMAEDLDDKDDDEKDDMDDDEEDIEDEFEDDEDDDYNAERYFDDGNEDYADNGDDEAAF